MEYITLKKLSELSGIHKNTLYNRCRKGKYIYRLVDGNGGKSYEVLVSSLDKTLQNKLLEEGALAQGEMVSSVNTTYFPFSAGNSNIPLSLDTNPPSNKDNCSDLVVLPNTTVVEQAKQVIAEFGLDKLKFKNRIIPQKIKEKALLKVDLINKWQNYINQNTHFSKGKLSKEFISQYNAQLIYPTLYKALGNVSCSTLYRWHNLYKSSNNDYITLCENYSYSSINSLTTTLSDIEKYYLVKYMLHQNKFSLGRAYELIKYELKKQGIEHISSYSAYNHVWNFLKKNHSEKIAFARGGHKNLLDTQAPHIIRDWTKIQAGEMLVGDGHVLDFMIKNPFTGKPTRATLVGFVDCASRDLVGYEIMMSENTQCIASALRNSIMYLKKIPKVIHLDNGKAFKGKFFTKQTDLTTSGIEGLYSKLGIKTYFSKAYNGRAKIIERFFKEFTESFAKIVPSYIGNNIANKPAYTMRNEKYHRALQGDECPTVQDIKIALDWWLNEIYRKRASKAYSNKTIAQHIQSGFGEGINADELDDLMLVGEIRKIGRNGVKLFDEYYFNEKMFGLDQSVIVKYNIFDLSYIKIYGKNMEFICKADRILAVNPLARVFGSPKDLEEYKSQQREKDKLIKSRINQVKKVLNTLHKRKTVNLEKIIENKQEIKKLENKEAKKYVINYAENIIDVEPEKVYNIDYSGKTAENPAKYKLY